MLRLVIKLAMYLANLVDDPWEFHRLMLNRIMAVTSCMPPQCFKIQEFCSKHGVVFVLYTDDLYVLINMRNMRLKIYMDFIDGNS